MLLEGLQQPEAVSLVSFDRQDTDVEDLGHSAAEDIPEPAHPVPDLVGEDQVTFLNGAGVGAGQLSEPGGKLLALLHFADRQVTL
jgi:hypothetical protein